MLVAAITSNLVDRGFSILLGTDDLEEGTLKTESIVRADKLYSLSQSLALKKLGRLKEATFCAVKAKIIELLGSGGS